MPLFLKNRSFLTGIWEDWYTWRAMLPPFLPPFLSLSFPPLLPFRPLPPSPSLAVALYSCTVTVSQWWSEISNVFSFCDSPLFCFLNTMFIEEIVNKINNTNIRRETSKLKKNIVRNKIEKEKWKRKDYKEQLPNFLTAINTFIFLPFLKLHHDFLLSMTKFLSPKKTLRKLGIKLYWYTAQKC